MSHFVKRINKVKDLSLEIDISENHLWVNDELICLFSSDKKHCEVNILAIKLINDIT